MSINRRDIIAILRDENEQLKERNKQVGSRLARLQQAFRVLIDVELETRLLQPGLDLEKLFYKLLGLVMHACNVEHGSLILVDEAAGELEFVEVIGDTRNALLNHRITVDTGVVGQVIRNAEAILIENVHASRKWSSSVDDYLGFHTQSLMCAPLQVEGRVMGALEVVNQPAETVFDENDLNIFRVAASLVSLALERAEKLTLSQELNE